MPPYIADNLLPTPEDIHWDGDLSTPFFFDDPNTGERQTGLSFETLRDIRQGTTRRQHIQRQVEREQRRARRRQRFPTTIPGQLYSFINQQIDVYLARQEQQGLFPDVQVLFYINELDAWHDLYMEYGHEAGDFPLPDPYSPVAPLIDWQSFNNLFSTEE